MKQLGNIGICILLLGTILSCVNEWDDHYDPKDQIIDNPNIMIENLSIIEYIQSEESLSGIYDLFKETGVLDRIEAGESQGQLVTVLVMDNSKLPSDYSTEDEKVYFANSLVSDIAISPPNLSDGFRFLMWNQKYLNVGVDGDISEVSNISFNGSKVSKIIKVQNGYVYELQSQVHSPKSMYEIIKELDGNYSIFRDMILSKNEIVFDKEASDPIGVDNTGSTIYDSVFVTTNPYFADRDFDLMSESLTATMLIPSNDVINEAIQTAKDKLSSWNMTRADTIIENWIYEAVFFREVFEENDFLQNEDLTSVFGKQWRTTVQEVDFDHSILMSNGVAYYVKKMKIPTNVLIYRLKDYFKWYEILSDTDKEKYYKTENLSFDEVKTDVPGWSGWPAGGFPLIENRAIYYKITDPEAGEYNLEFIPYHISIQSDGTYEAASYLVPPGEYDLCMGFKQNLGHDVEVSFNGEVVRKITTSDFTATTFHYDRGGQGYPEGYEVSKATDSKRGHYDRDGGRVGTVTIEGDEAVEVSLNFRGTNIGGSTMFHHWCLKPTKNCY